MAEIVHNVKFEPIQTKVGWCVAITPPSGGRCELHDFQTEAGAKAWISANARSWIIGFVEKPREGPIWSNPRT